MTSAGDRNSVDAICRPFHGLEYIFSMLPRVPLRSTLGFMLPPAPQARWMLQLKTDALARS